MSIILSIGTAVPPYEYKQLKIAKFMIEALRLEQSEARKISYLYRRSGIETRYSIIPDYDCMIEDRVFYPKTHDLEPFPDIAQRMTMYSEAALPLASKAIRNAQEQLDLDNLSKITHLITVSCTGLVAPGLDIDLVQKLELSPSVHRTAINFMGCYAAFSALRVADSICNSDPEACVLVVCVELCSLHFQKSLETDHLISNSLFADGAAAVIVAPDTAAVQNRYLQIKAFHSELSMNGRSDMAWQLSKTGFQMTLSAYIPDLLYDAISPLAEKVMNRLNLNPNDIKHWAIHPGGRKILESIGQAFNLQKEDLASSYNILQQYGNMSSPTVLFVLQDLWDYHISWLSREMIFSSAFGPGLTLESTILEAKNG